MGKRSLPVWVFRVFRLTGKLRLPMAPVSKAFRNRYYLSLCVTGMTRRIGKSSLKGRSSHDSPAENSDNRGGTRVIGFGPIGPATS